jgi:hypothetical protein
VRSAQLANEAARRLAGLTEREYTNPSWSNWPDLTCPRLAGFAPSPEADGRLAPFLARHALLVADAMSPAKRTSTYDDYRTVT